jgi:hypothetical protein
MYIYIYIYIGITPQRVQAKPNETKRVGTWKRRVTRKSGKVCILLLI